MSDKEISEAKKTYAGLWAQSQMTPVAFKEACRKVLLEESPQGWLIAARRVVAEIAEQAKKAAAGELPAPVELPPPPPAQAVQQELPIAEPPPAAPVPPPALAAPVPAGKKLLSIPPSILIGGGVSQPGDVRYATLDETTEITEYEEQDKKLKKSDRTKTTKKIVRDVEEYKEATTKAERMRSRIREICQPTIFGLLCPLSKENQLYSILEDLRAEELEWNRKAKRHFLRVSYEPAMIDSASDRVARQLAYDIQQDVDRLQAALTSCDARAIQNAVANAKQRAKNLEIPVGDRARLESAWASATAAIKLIKSAEDKARTIDEIKEAIDLAPVEAARLTFLQYAVPESLEAARASAAMTRFVDLNTVASASPALEPETSEPDPRFSGLQSAAASAGTGVSA